MILFRKENKSTFYTLELSSLEGLLALSYGNPIIFAALCNQNGCIPLIDPTDGVKVAVAFLSSGIIFFPIRSSISQLTKKSSSVVPYILSRLKTPAWAINVRNRFS